MGIRDLSAASLADGVHNKERRTGMDLYETLLKRRSVRRYTENAPDAVTLQSIREAALKPLFPEIEVKIELIGKTELPQFFLSTGSVRAPCYAVITSRKSPFAKLNAGFLGEQLVAELTLRGLGTCWSGGLKASKTAFPLDYLIAIGFGYPKNGLLREPEQKLSRKTTEEICPNPPGSQLMKDAVEAVRVAPSAVNRQPWRLEPEGNTLHVFCEKPSFLTSVGPGPVKFFYPGAALEKLQEIDCGIALAHILICAEHFGAAPEFRRIAGKEKAGEKRIYMMSAVLNPEKKSG